MIYESKRNQRGFKNYVVESIEDYIELVTRLYVEGKEYWFRGQNDEAYRLVPTGLRELYAIQDSRGNRFDKPIKDTACSGSNNIVAYLPINEMVEAFSIEAREYVEYDVNNQIEWECIAQHYGLPTRLLDWTTNALDALYFAVSDCALKDDDGCYDSFLESGFGGQGGVVFVIDPLEINRETVPFRDGKKSFVFDVNNDKEIGKIYEELLSILNTFPKVSPTDILKNIEFPPCYSMESFESVIEILNYQINDGKEKLDSEMVSQKEKRDIKSDIEKRKYCIEQIKKNQEDYFKAKEAYCLFKQSDKMIIDMYAGQSVRNCLVEFEVVLHNAFISGHSVGDAYDSSKNLIEVTRNKIVNAIRNDIGTIR